MSNPVASGAAVGINDELWSGSWIDVGGTLQIDGTTAFAGLLQVGGDLELGSEAIFPALLDVGRDRAAPGARRLLGGI